MLQEKFYRQYMKDSTQEEEFKKNAPYVSTYGVFSYSQIAITRTGRPVAPSIRVHAAIKIAPASGT